MSDWFVCTHDCVFETNSPKAAAAHTAATGHAVAADDNQEEDG